MERTEAQSQHCFPEGSTQHTELQNAATLASLGADGAAPAGRAAQFISLEQADME